MAVAMLVGYALYHLVTVDTVLSGKYLRRAHHCHVQRVLE
jgi:hypothetical protein